MSQAPAVRVTDQFAHSSALSGALIGLAVGVAAGAFILATGGLGAIAVGAAIGVVGGAGLAGQAIGGTMMGPPTGAILTGSPNVLTNYLPQGAATIATGPCSKESGVPQAVATGVPTVLINNMPAARKGETMTCSAKLISGSPDVVIGGDSIQVLPIEPEVPAWLSNTMAAMAIGGTIIATGGIAAAYGPVTAVGSLVGGMAGSHYVGQGASNLAAYMGFGETGQTIAGVVGGFAGGAVFGGAGFRGGRWFDSRYQFQSQGLGSNFGNVRIVPRQPPAQPSPFQTRIDPAHPGRPDPRWSVDTRNFDPNAPTASRTAGGAIRDNKQFWNEWAQRHPETLSRGNQHRINEMGLSPKVDRTWTQHFPEHSNYKGQTIEHHHYNQGDIAIPLPWEVHRGAGNYNIWHGP